VAGVADGFDRLQEAFSTLGEGARGAINIRFDPNGTSETLAPLKQLRRDVALESQVMEHLSGLGAESGDYALRLTEAGRVVTQATISLRFPSKKKTPEGEGGPGVPGQIPAPAPAPTPEMPPGTGEDLFRDVGRKLVERALASKLSEEEEDEDDEEGEDDEEAPAGAGVLGVVERVLESPVLQPVAARLLDAAAGWLENHSQLMGARARLNEARAVRNGAAPAKAAEGVSRPGPGGRVVGFRRVSKGGGGEGGDSGATG
jgi:hypothetical protein